MFNIRLHTVNDSKYFYVSIKFQLSISHLSAHSLNGQTILFEP